MASAATTGGKAAAGATPPSATHTAELRKLMLSLAPPLSSSAHKGQSGRVGVIGGSKAYTGAPYFAAMTPLLMGADLSTVFCSVEAGVAIKSYGPDLMVRPCLFPTHLVQDAIEQLGKSKDAKGSKEDKESAAISAIVSDVLEWTGRMDVMILGPGLGKDDLIMRTVASWLEKHAAGPKLDASSSSGSSSPPPPPCPVVLDGDALHMLTDYASASVTHGAFSPRMILTPNAMEFRRLWTRFMRSGGGNGGSGGEAPPPPDFSVAIDPAWLEANPGGGVIPTDHPYARDTAALARALHGATVVRKGSVDVISDGTAAAIVTTEGSPRRVGGQGDLLAGATGMFLTWTKLRTERMRKEQERRKQSKDAGSEAASSSSASPLPDSLLSAYCASQFGRALQRSAYASHGRSMLASNLIESIPAVMHQMFPLDGVHIDAADDKGTRKHKL